MLRFNTQKRRRSVTVLTLLFALCASGITPATAAQATNPPLPVITSVHLDLPSAGKITINGTGFGSGRPTVVMGGPPLAVNDGFSNTEIVANLPTPLPAAGDYLLVVTNTLGNQIGELTVTIGVAGTQGPKGDKDDPGEKPDLTALLTRIAELEAFVGFRPPRAYVANNLSDNVSVINTASESVIATIPVGSAPRGVAVR